MKRLFFPMLLIAGLLTMATPEAQASPRSHVAVKSSPAKVWVPAALTLQHGQLVFVAGHFKVPPRANVRWVAGKWEGHGKSRRWVPGHWQTRR